jgi:hypothetical protein
MIMETKKEARQVEASQNLRLNPSTHVSDRSEITTLIYLIIAGYGK